MVERQYENDKMVYINVATFFHPDSKLQPVAFWSEDECYY